MFRNRSTLIAALMMFLCTAAFGQTSFFTTLSGSNEPDGGDPDGVGHAVVTISGNTLTFVATAANLAAISGAHIHRISTGGNVVVNFAPSGQSAPAFTNGIATGTVTAATQTAQDIFNEIIANPSNFYVNVHSSEKPGGAIRGTLSPLSAGAAGLGTSGQATQGACIESDTAMCLNSNRFKVEATWTKPGTSGGAGHAVRLTNDTGYFWFFNSTNVEVDVKVLNACNPFNSQWVFASGLTNVEVTLIVTDTQTGKTRTYKNPNATPFLPIQDTSAFACP